MKSTLFICLALAFLAGCTSANNTPESNADNADQMAIAKQECHDVGGEWVSNVLECQGVSQEQCESIGGTWNECASACRNDPDAEVCTMQCVQICQFK